MAARVTGRGGAAEGEAGIAAGARRGWEKAAWAGWGVSIGLHVGLGILLARLVFSGAEAEGVKWSAARMELERLAAEAVEPVISNLKVQYYGTEGARPGGAAEAAAGPGGADEADGRESGVRAAGAGGRAAVLGVTGDGAGALVAADTGQGEGQFCGVAGAGGAVAYVVDCSGSMVMAFDYIQAELTRAIEALTPGQYFAVVFYAAGEPVEWMPGRLLRANAPNRQAAGGFVKRMQLAPVGEPGATARAVGEALARALAARRAGGGGVELVYLLTDGQYDHGAAAAVLESGGGGVRVNIVACGSREHEAELRRLAARQGGQYRFVTDEELARGAGSGW